MNTLNRGKQVTETKLKNIIVLFIFTTKFLFYFSFLLFNFEFDLILAETICLFLQVSVEDITVYCLLIGSKWEINIVVNSAET